MEIYTEDERYYHMNVIEDAIEVYEHEKDSSDFTIEEHIDLVLLFDAQADILNGTNDIINVKEYTTLYAQAQAIAKRIATIYHKQREFRDKDYYDFCKIVQKLMKILSSESIDSIENLFGKMTM